MPDEHNRDPPPPPPDPLPGERQFYSDAMHTFKEDRDRTRDVLRLALQAPWAAHALGLLPPDHELFTGASARPREVREMWAEVRAQLPAAVFNRVLLETWHCRMVDRFEDYMALMLTDVLKLKPSQLKPKGAAEAREPIPIVGDEFLRCKRYDDLVGVLAEKKLRRLLGGGFGAILAYLKSHGLMPERGDTADVNEAIQVRHILVHNRGLVNEEFLRKAKRSDIPLGGAIPLTLEYVTRAEFQMFLWAQWFDVGCQKKLDHSFSTVERVPGEERKRNERDLPVHSRGRGAAVGPARRTPGAGGRA